MGPRGWDHVDVCRILWAEAVGAGSAEKEMLGEKRGTVGKWTHMFRDDGTLM